MLLGTYEQACVPWSPREAPWTFDMELLPPDLDRIAPSLEIAFKHYPAMATAGIKRIVNGPFTFAPDGNPLVGPIRGRAQLLGGLRGDGRAVAGRRRRPHAGQLDDDGDPQLDIWGDGRRPLRRLGEPRLHQRQGAGELQPAVPHHVPQRGAPGRPAAAHDAGLRPAHRAQRGVGRRLRARAPAVVPAARRGAGRGRDVPPLQRLPGRRRGVPRGARAGRAHRVLELRQVPRDRRRRGRLAAGAVHQPPAASRPDRPDADAQPRRPDRRRVLRRPHRRRRFLPVRLAGRRGAPLALVPRPPAGRRRRSASTCSACRSSGCRSPGRTPATCCSR